MLPRPLETCFDRVRVFCLLYVYVITYVSMNCPYAVTMILKLLYLSISRIWYILAITRRICFINTLRPWQNGRRFADDTFKCVFLSENVRISIKISLKFVPKGPINNIPALVQIIAWRRSGDKPLSEPMLASLLTHICVTRPQWVKIILSSEL